MILLVDNYDSFVYNLARYFERLGQEVCVVRNDALDLPRVRAMQPAALVLSPGPCTPRQAGASLELVRLLHTDLPMLGVCLGHQVIAEALGARIVRAPRPVHGQTSDVHHDGTGLFATIASPMRVCRYHSLVVEPDSLPAVLRPTGWCDGDVLMAFEHECLPVFGVQFHPEAILTEGGFQLLANFLRQAGLDANAPTDLAADELKVATISQDWKPPRPVTF